MNNRKWAINQIQQEKNSNPLIIDQMRKGRTDRDPFKSRSESNHENRESVLKNSNTSLNQKCEGSGQNRGFPSSVRQKQQSNSLIEQFQPRKQAFSSKVQSSMGQIGQKSATNFQNFIKPMQNVQKNESSSIQAPQNNSLQIPHPPIQTKNIQSQVLNSNQSPRLQPICAYLLQQIPLLYSKLLPYIEQKTLKTSEQRPEKFSYQNAFINSSSEQPIEEHYIQEMLLKQKRKCKNAKELRIIYVKRNENQRKLRPKKIVNKKIEDSNFYNQERSVFPNVSDFGSFIDLQYSVDFKQKKYTGKVQISSSLPKQEIDESIFADLQRKGCKIGKGSVIIREKCEPKKKRQSWLQWLRNQKIVYSDNIDFTGTIMEEAILLPQGYSYEYEKIEGFEIEDLTVFNEFGSITWVGCVNIASLNLSKGISIEREQVECQIYELQKQAIVEFYNLPHAVEKITNSKKLKQKLKRIAHAQNCEFMDVDISFRRWRVKVNFKN